MTGSEAYYVLHLHHGTSKTYSNMITESGFEFPKVKRKDHWLGNGIYFFREDKEQAMMWACSKFKDSATETEVHVLQTRFEIHEDNFLDLDSRGGLSKFETFVDAVKKQLGEVKFKSDPAKLRNFIMDMLPKKYTVIQRTFDVTSKRFDNHPILAAAELNLHGKQVCIRDKSVITGDINVVMTKSL